MINSDFQSSEDGDYRLARSGVAKPAFAQPRTSQASKSPRVKPIPAIEIRIEEGDRIFARRIVTFSISDAGNRQNDCAAARA